MMVLVVDFSSKVTASRKKKQLGSMIKPQREKENNKAALDDEQF